MIFIYARYEEVDIAVVVEIGCSDADRIAAALQAGTGRHVSKAAVPFVAQ